MKLKTQINAVGLVRGIRDAQAKRLANRFAVEVIDFFNGAAERAEKRTNPVPADFCIQGA